MDEKHEQVQNNEELMQELRQHQRENERAKPGEPHLVAMQDLLFSHEGKPAYLQPGQCIPVWDTHSREVITQYRWDVALAVEMQSYLITTPEFPPAFMPDMCRALQEENEESIDEYRQWALGNCSGMYKVSTPDLMHVGMSFDGPTYDPAGPSDTPQVQFQEMNALDFYHAYSTSEQIRGILPRPHWFAEVAEGGKVMFNPATGNHVRVKRIAFPFLLQPVADLNIPGYDEHNWEVLADELVTKVSETCQQQGVKKL